MRGPVRGQLLCNSRRVHPRFAVFFSDFFSVFFSRFPDLVEDTGHRNVCLGPEPRQFWSPMVWYSSRRIRTGVNRRIMAFLLGLLATLIRLWTWRARRREASDLRDILCLEPYGMGDVISLEPLVRVLSRQGFRVHVCARRPWKPLLSGDQITSWLDSRIPWASYDTKKKYSWRLMFGRGFREFMGHLRMRGRGAIGFDTRGDIRNVILLHLAGCTRVYTLSHYLGSDMKVLPAAARILPMNDHLERWRLNLEFLKVVNATAGMDESPPSLGHLAAAGGKQGKLRFVAFIAASPWPGRLWAQERWRALSRKIVDSGLTPLVLHGPGQGEYAESLARSRMFTVECPTIEDWVRRLQEATAVVSINTGPMHMAAALNKPLVVIDGPSKLPLWQPAVSTSRVIHYQEEVKCAPCHQITSEEACGYECMKRITVEEVFRALLEVLEADVPDGFHTDRPVHAAGVRFKKTRGSRTRAGR